MIVTMMQVMTNKKVVVVQVRSLKVAIVRRCRVHD